MNLNADPDAETWWRHDPGRRPTTVVLTHGAGTDHRMFDDLVSRLRGAGFGTLVWDVPGHGRSPLVAEKFRIADAAQELTRLIDRAGIAGPVVLLGQSMGGNIAQRVLLDSPERCAALIAIGSTSNTLPITRVERAQLRMAAPVLRLLPRRTLFRSMVNSSAVSDGARSYLESAFNAIGRRTFLKVWAGVARAVSPLPNYVATLPQLLIVGSEDRTGNIRVAMRSWARRDPRAQLVEVEGAGHVAQLDQPDVVARHVLDFMEKEVG